VLFLVSNHISRLIPEECNSCKKSKNWKPVNFTIICNLLWPYNLINRRKYKIMLWCIFPLWYPIGQYKGSKNNFLSSMMLEIAQAWSAKLRGKGDRWIALGVYQSKQVPIWEKGKLDSKLAQVRRHRKLFYMFGTIQSHFHD